MVKPKLLILSLILPLVIGNQCTTAVKHAAIRTVSAPYHIVKGIYSAVTPDKYQGVIEEQNSLNLSAGGTPHCPELTEPTNTPVDFLNQTAQDLDDKLCKECKPWARVTSPAPFCSPTCANACQKVCPQKGFGILDHYKEKLLPTNKDKMSFRNSAAMFNDAGSSLIAFQGYCSGMVSSRRKFNMNGFFEPGSVPRDNNGKVIRDETDLVSYYQDIIEKVHSNKPTEIPGFKNLGEFTANPMIQDIMRQAIADEWADVTVLRSSANATAFTDPLLGKNKMNVKKSEKVISGLKEKIKHVGSGTLYIGLGGTANMHIIDAFDVISGNDGRSKICINDPNYSGTSHRLSYNGDKLVNCSPSVIVRKNGTMSYQGTTVTQARVDHPQDEATITTSIDRLRKYCKSKKNPPCDS